MITVLAYITACGVAAGVFWLQLHLLEWRERRKRKAYQCSVCKLEFADPKLARQCEQWCSTHNSCNLEIGRQAINRSPAPG
jgi:hypothetical protein